MSNAKNICTVCNYIYDEAVGEPRQHIAPLQSFEDLPEEWNCPDCNSKKEMFQPCSCVRLPGLEQVCEPHKKIKLNVPIDSKSKITKESPVGELVIMNPAFTQFFEQYGIDYCCGGKISLADACQKRHLDVETIMQKLNIVYEKLEPVLEPDWTRTSLKELIDHILASYHDPLRLELKRILALTDKVARVHGNSHPEMIKVAEIFARLKEQLELHMQKEELILFPGIAAMEANKSAMFGCGAGIEHPIAVMTMEHEDAGEALCTLRNLTNDYNPPPDACTTFKVLLKSLANFESEMHLHVHKENNILFPRCLKISSASNEAKSSIAIS